MSEYNVVQVQFKDKTCLVDSLKEIGYECEVHDKARNLNGYLGDTRSQVANIIIRRKNIGSASNDIGFLKKVDGTYDMIISEFDIRCEHGKKFTETLKQIYGKNMVLKQAKRLGLSTLSVNTDNKGRIKIRLMDGRG